jgi:hypothetical protein
MLKSSGARHVKFGIKDAHYDSVGSALLWTLQQGNSILFLIVPLSHLVSVHLYYLVIPNRIGC